MSYLAPLKLLCWPVVGIFIIENRCLLHRSLHLTVLLRICRLLCSSDRSNLDGAGAVLTLNLALAMARKVRESAIIVN